MFGIIVSLFGAILSAYGQYQQGRAQAAAARAQAQIAANNAEIQRRNAEFRRQQAEDAIKRGKAEAAQKAIETRRLRGAQRAALAGAGQVIDTGTALNITEDTVQFGRMDDLTIRANARREALGYEMEAYNAEAGAANFMSEASIKRSEARNALTASRLGMASTLLTATGSAYNTYQKIK